jgi:hypothetical protein
VRPVEYIWSQNTRRSFRTGNCCGPSPEGPGRIGDPCAQDRDCAAGLHCGSGATSVCAPYCDPVDVTSPLACETLCPGAYTEVWSMYWEITGLCMADAGAGP